MKTMNEQIYRTTKRNFHTKKGVKIAAGERVELTFDVKAKDQSLRPEYVRMRTADGRSIIGPFQAAGLRMRAGAN
jgi:hypothetical protein